MKKVFSALLALLLAAVLLAGCSAKNNGLLPSADYMNWTAAEWNRANDTEKANCVDAYLHYIAERIDVGDDLNDDTFDDEIREMIPQIGEALNAIPSATLKQLTDFGIEHMNDAE